MVGCSAPNCTNRAVKGGYKMKRFPADPTIRQVWINNVRRADWNWNPPANFRNCRLCEIHFDANQFEYKNPDGSGRRLKPRAIPTVFNVHPGPVCQSNLSSLSMYRPRRRKKVVGNFNPILCLSNQQMSDLQKHTADMNENIINIPLNQNITEPILDPNISQRKQTEKMSDSLPIVSYMEEQNSFSQLSTNQIQYSYHKKVRASSSTDSMVFPGRRTETIHLPTLSMSSNERITSVLPLSTQQLIGLEHSTNTNNQPIMEPAEIKLEYVDDSQYSDRRVDGQMKTMANHPSSPILHAIKLCEESIQTSTLQEQIRAPEMFPQNHPTNVPTLMSHDIKEIGHYSNNITMVKNHKVDCDFTVSKPKENVQFPEIINQSQVSIDNDVARAIKRRFTPVVSSHSDTMYKQSQQNLSRPDNTRNESSLSKLPASRSDMATGETESKHSYYLQLSTDSQLQTSLSEKHQSMQVENTEVLRDSDPHQLIIDDSINNDSTNEELDVAVLEMGSPSVSESEPTIQDDIKFHERHGPSFTRRRDRQIQNKNKIYSKFTSVENLHRKLLEEKRKSQKLKLENQKLRKQLGPLRSLQYWITRFLNTDQIEQLQQLKFGENTVETLQKAMKLCSIVCGYLSNVVSFPFYSTQTRPV